MRNLFVLLILSYTLWNPRYAAAQSATYINVYRWYHPGFGYRLVAEDECPELTLTSDGWSGKTLLFKAYQAAEPHTVAVNAWYNPVGHAYISVAADEFTDDQMRMNGYTGKHFQFYALTKGEEGSVPVYRYLCSKRRSWVTVPGDDISVAAGYHHKTYQYFGLKAR